jgi:peroxiredoxin family protein
MEDMFRKFDHCSVTSATRMSTNEVINNSSSASTLDVTPCTISSKLYDVSLRKSTDEVGNVTYDLAVGIVRM